MTIPPFPSQDLAKLVLGYLAEEQLMTAYDEFLQASPYLDALGNEYDRIFMTSLKNILAEYRAVKIYVETCKPFQLRKRLFQCSNLLDIVKFLISYIDVNKLQDNNESKYSEKQTNVVSTNSCEICNSLKIKSCMCKSKHVSVSNIQTDTRSSNSSLETTSLADLPGNHVTLRKKGTKGKDSNATVNSTNEQNDLTVKIPSVNVQVENTVAPSTKVDCLTRPTGTLQNYGLPVQTNEPFDMKQKEEFNNILNQVCNNNLNVAKPGSGPEVNGKTRFSIEGYKDFETGVTGGDTGSDIVPDSNTGQNLHVQIPALNNDINTPDVKNTKRKQTRAQYLLKVANVNNTVSSDVVSINTLSNNPPEKSKSNPDENKIKILSDIKVDNSFNSKETIGSMKLPSVLKNATSTPLLQMQTIVINGTPVYKQNLPSQHQNYTKDEIMAMPTIILAPASGQQQFQENTSGSSTMPQQFQASSSVTARQLGSLILDVATRKPGLTSDKPDETMCVPKLQEEVKDDFVPISVDTTSASAPKDQTALSVAETSTPQVLPPLRKSSSTPRRSAHVRVLDFTTPRRILHETANKCVQPTFNDVEVVLSRSPSLANSSVDSAVEIRPSLKENSLKTPIFKKKNWDSDLRALIVIPEQSIEMDNSKSKPKTKSAKKRVSKRKLIKNKKENDKKGNERSSKKNSTKAMSSKKLLELEVELEEATVPIVTSNKQSISVKPTINIITGPDRRSTSFEKDKAHNKSNSDHIVTPEMERISLQNEIGVKLNISDLLETPYKQALYDIQMETPRFLGPDIPDGPISDIKIMNIPTPRFLNAAATPSSYSSRPTDYSSGGSYYKPDEQDYMRVTDDLICPVTSTVENQTSNLSDTKEVGEYDHKNKTDDKPSRPVRQCTKNVSYYNSSIVNNKAKENDNDTIETVSSDTENSLCETTPDKIVNMKPKENKSKPKNKPDVKKKAVTKKRKTPVKKEVSKSFMRIRPRRPTPTKRNRNTKEISTVQTRKKAADKDGSASTTSVVAAPTKSRRKSSTPRKIHCTKTFNSESSGQTSPELLISKGKKNIPGAKVAITQDSDTEQLRLQWSDDGSQESQLKEPKPKAPLVNPNIDSDEIIQIKEYIETTIPSILTTNDGEGSLHIDLVKRGFDLETAKIIERDLLDTSPQRTQEQTTVIPTVVDIKPASIIQNDHVVLDKNLESDCGMNKDLQIVQDNREEEEEEDDEVELSVHECDEDSTNYFVCSHDDTKDLHKEELATLKDKFCMEICLDDDFSVRLRATPYCLVLDEEPKPDEETELAVSSIINIDKLYTPIKESMKSQCFEIFDSTLTSLDTPLKVNSPKKQETQVTVSEIVLEVEKVEVKEKSDTKKRKRLQSGNLSDEGVNDSKKAKPEAQYLFNSANIQNIDIESVLSKLHGP